MLCRVVWYNFTAVLEDAAAFIVRVLEKCIYYYYYYNSLQLSFHPVAVVLTLVTNKNKYT